MASLKCSEQASVSAMNDMTAACIERTEGRMNKMQSSEAPTAGGGGEGIGNDSPKIHTVPVAVQTTFFPICKAVPSTAQPKCLEHCKRWSEVNGSRQQNAETACNYAAVSFSERLSLL